MIQENEFTKELVIHHRGMVPYVAYIVMSGEVQLIDQQGNVKLAGPGEVLGLMEVWNHMPYEFEIRTSAGTNLLSLDRSLLAKMRQALFNPLA